MSIFSRFLLKYGSSHISDYVDVSIRQNIVEMLKTWTPPETGVAARFMIRLSLRMEGG